MGTFIKLLFRNLKCIKVHRKNVTYPGGSEYEDLEGHIWLLVQLRGSALLDLLHWEIAFVTLRIMHIFCLSQ